MTVCPAPVAIEFNATCLPFAVPVIERIKGGVIPSTLTIKEPSLFVVAGADIFPLMSMATTAPLIATPVAAVPEIRALPALEDEAEETLAALETLLELVELTTLDEFDALLTGARLLLLEAIDRLELDRLEDSEDELELDVELDIELELSVLELEAMSDGDVLFLPPPHPTNEHKAKHKSPLKIFF